jgi:integrase
MEDSARILHLAGVPDQVIQKMLGHSSVRTTLEVYLHSTPVAQQRAAAERGEILGPMAVKHAQKNPG